MAQSSEGPEAGLERTGDQLEGRIERLEEHIDDAKEQAVERAEDADEPGEDLVGDWEDESVDAPRGDDPLGFDDPDALEDEDEDDF